MLKLELQYSGHLMWTADSVEKWVPGADKDWEHKKKSASEDEMARWITNATNMNLGKLQEMMRDREGWHAADHGAAKSGTQLGDWIAAHLKGKRSNDNNQEWRKLGNY